MKKREGHAKGGHILRRKRARETPRQRVSGRQDSSSSRTWHLSDGVPGGTALSREERGGDRSKLGSRRGNSLSLCKAILAAGRRGGEAFAIKEDMRGGGAEKILLLGT